MSTKFFYFLSVEAIQPEDIVRQAVAAEEAGFDGVMVSEHFHPWVEDVGSSGFAWSVMGAIATSTSKLEIMTAVTTPLWRIHPGVVAQAAATVDRLSSGRFTLGIGTGRAHDEEPLGFDYPSYSERADRLHEATEIIRRMLDGEKLTFNGRYYQTETAKLYSPPVHRIPVYIAAGGPKSAKLAASAADGIMVSVKQVTDTQEDVLAPARGINPDLGVAAARWVIMAEGEDEAWHALQPQRGLRAPNRDTELDPLKIQQAADALPRKDVLSKYSICSSNDEIFDVYQPLVTDMKADLVGFQVAALDEVGAIGRLGREVLPRLRGLT